MKKLILVLLISTACFSQAFRHDPNPATTTTGNTPPGALAPVLAIPGATIQIYNDLIMSAHATTYNSINASTACPSYAPVTLGAGGFCASTADAQGNFGFYLLPGTYWYTITTPQGIMYGPYAITGAFSIPQYVTQNGFGAVARLITTKLNETCTVTDFGADPTGTVDSLQAFVWALASCSTLLVPDGTYLLSNQFQINRSNFTMRCASQNAVLKYSGGVPVSNLVLVGPDSPFDVRIENCTMRGDAVGNVTTTLNLTKANSSFFINLQLKDAHTCLGHYGGVANTIDDNSCSVNNGGFLFRPTRGFDFGGRPENHLLAGTTTNINRPIIEGVYGAGMYFRDSASITVKGGTSEANVQGIVLADITASQITFEGIGVEANCLILSNGSYILNDAGACPGKYNPDGSPHDVGMIDAGFQNVFKGGSYVTGQVHYTTSLVGGPDHGRGGTMIDARFDAVLIDPTVEDVWLQHNNNEITGTRIPGIISNGDPLFPYGINTTIIGNYKANGGIIDAVEQTIAGNLFLHSPLVVTPDDSAQSFLTLTSRNRTSRGMRMHMAEAGNINRIEALDTLINPNWNVFISADNSYTGLDTFLYTTTRTGTPTARLHFTAGGATEFSNAAGIMPVQDSTMSVNTNGMIGADWLKLRPMHFANCAALVDKICRIDDFSGVPAWGAVVTTGTGTTGTYATIIYSAPIGWTVMSR